MHYPVSPDPRCSQSGDRHLLWAWRQHSRGSSVALPDIAARLFYSEVYARAKFKKEAFIRKVRAHQAYC